MRAILSVIAVLLAAYPFGTPVSAYSLGDCSYVSANGTQITGLSCPDAPFPVSVSGSSIPNADYQSLPGSYFPAVLHVDGVFYLSFSAVLTVSVWFVAILSFSFLSYRLSAVSLVSGFNFFRKSKPQS